MTSTDASYQTRRGHERMSYQPHMDGDPSTGVDQDLMLVTNKTRLETSDIRKSVKMYTGRGSTDIDDHESNIHC